MKRILLRSGKSPFDVVSAGRTLEENIIGGNNGNLLFASAAHKLLSVTGAEVVSTENKIDPASTARINAEFDGFVLPLANAFRPDFEAELLRITKFIEKLKIPVMMLSGGAQSGADGGFAGLRRMETTIKRFARAVLDKSPAVTVRGARTATYLDSIGIRDVEIIGCPSLTFHGPDFLVSNPARITARSKVAYNVETSKDFLAETVAFNQDKYRNFTYLPQDRRTLEMMLWGGEAYAETRDPRLPLRTAHRQFQEGLARYFVDPKPWMDFLGGYDLSFGPRIHGNIAAILGGTPAVVTAHDSRTLELAEYHSLPFITAPEFSGPMDAKDIATRADFTDFNAGQSERFERVRRHFEACGFETIFDVEHSDALQSYNERLSGTEFPLPVRFDWPSMEPGLKDRFEVLRRQKARNDKNILDLRAKLGATEARIAALEVRYKR